MSATIKYKGNTIATITTDSTKTLKTSGKYCEGDIVVENVQDGGGGSELVLSDIQLPAVTFCTDVIENHIVSSDWSPSVTAVEYIPPKYYYNDVLLPEIPADVLAEYPYCLMYYDSSNENMQLLLGKGIWYVAPSTDSAYTHQLWCSVDNDLQWYYCNVNSGATWSFYKTTTGWWGDITISWSNHDIPNGSATATEIYFESTPLVPEITLPRYNYNGHVLPAIPAELLELRPYAFIYKNATYCSLILSSVPYTYREATDTATERLAATNADGCIKNYRFPVKYEQEIEYWPYRNDSWYYWENTQNLLWSNYNILNETTEEVYFNGSEPVLVEGSDN